MPYRVVESSILHKPPLSVEAERLDMIHLVQFDSQLAICQLDLTWDENMLCSYDWAGQTELFALRSSLSDAMISFVFRSEWQLF